MSERVIQTHTIKIGGYSNEMNAQRELADFQDAGVFEARSAVFPNPRQFGMMITVKKAEIEEWDSVNPLNSHCIKVELELNAPNAQAIDSWLGQVNNRLRAFAPVTYKREGSERSASNTR